MRLAFILALIVATVAPYNLVQSNKTPRKWYIVAGNDYAIVDYERANLFFRVWRDRQTLHEFDEWAPSAWAIKKLTENRTVGVSTKGPLEVVVIVAEPPRHFLFAAPSFTEIDREKHMMLKTSTPNFIEHFVDQEWNRVSYKIELMAVNGEPEKVLAGNECEAQHFIHEAASQETASQEGRVPVLLLLTCLLGFYTNTVAADCYQCAEGLSSGEAAVLTDYTAGITDPKPCASITEGTTPTCPGNKCIHMVVDAQPTVHLRNCATPKPWRNGRLELGKKGAAWAQACEGDRCNKLSVDELKEIAVDMKAEDAKDDKDAKKSTGSSISAMLPVIAFLVANMPAFF
ncbi:unnamed protein product, partial [Mesorhabditis spiculigera]